MWPDSEAAFNRRIAAAAIFLVSTGVLFAGEATAQVTAPVTRAARRIEWTEPNAERLRALFTEAHVVRTFLNEIDAAGDPSAPGAFSAVGAFRFVDLGADGSLELVALADVSGRAFFNDVVVVYDASDRRGPRKPLETEFEGFGMRQVPGVGVGGLDSVVRDLDHDGHHEIVIPELIGPYAGAAQPNAVLPEVYAWNDEHLVKVSARYQAFYRDEVLPRLERELQKLEALPAAADTSQRAERRARRDVCEREIAEARKRLPPK